MAHLYQDPSKSIAERVADLLGRMTVAEKIAQMHAAWLILEANGAHQVRGDDGFISASDPLGLTATLRNGLGQITRPLGARSIDPAEGVRALNVLQKFMIEETRLGIPVMSHEKCLSGIMARGGTLFPSSLAFGATWNPDLIEKVGKAIGDEARSLGCRQGLAPVLDVARDARWGRTEETFGEDPYLVGVLASRYVRGLQGEKRDLLATLKHYVGHSFSEGGRNHAPVHLGWRELNDTFLLPFEMAVKLANAGSVTPAYHDIDNEPCHASHRLLTRVLREEWGFDGLVVADYIGVDLLYQHHGVAADEAEAAALSFNAGLDIELPGGDCSLRLEEALERKLITVDKIDEIVARVLTEKFRLGLFERPYADEDAIVLRSDEAIDVARRVAEQSVVILDNDGVLPLKGKPKVALIGPTADDPLALLGDYSFPVHLIQRNELENASVIVTPKKGFENALGVDHVDYARGCYILEQRQAGAPVFPGDVTDSASVGQMSPVSTRLDLIPEAVEKAKAADVAIVCVGDLSGYEDVSVDDAAVDIETGEIAVSFTLRNVGGRAGVAVPQLYVRDELATLVRPVKELKAFARVELAAGESRRVTFHVPTDMLGFTGLNGRRIVEPGFFELMIGASSGDIRLRARVEVLGAVRSLGRNWRMESRCAVRSPADAV